MREQLLTTLRNPSPAVLGTLLGTLCAGFYLSTLSSHYTYDSVAYSLDVEHALVTGRPDRLLHDYHILWNAIGWALAKVADWARDSPVTGFQILNAFSASVLVGAIAVVVARSTGRKACAAGALLLAGHGTYWFFAVQAESYPVATALTLASLAILPLSPGDGHGTSKTCVSAALLGCASLVHLTGIVLAPIAAGFLLLDADRRRGLKRAGAFTAVFVASVLPLYVFKSTIDERPGLSGVSGFLRGVLSDGNPARGSYFLTKPWSPFVEARAVAESFSPEHWPAGVLALLLATMAFAGAVVEWRGGRRRLPLLAACIVVYVAFFASYNLGAEKFTVVQAALLIVAGLLGWVALTRERPRWRAFDWSFPVAGVVLLLLNMSAAHDRTDPATNDMLRLSLTVGEITSSADAVIIPGRGDYYPLKVYLPYFARRRAIILDFLFNSREISPEESWRRVRLRADRALAEGGAVHVLATLLEDTRDRRKFLERNGLPADWLDARLEVAGPSVVFDGEAVLYSVRLRPAPQ